MPVLPYFFSPSLSRARLKGDVDVEEGVLCSAWAMMRTGTATREHALTLDVGPRLHRSSSVVWGDCAYGCVQALGQAARALASFTMVQLDENKFLTELGKMYERHKSSGSVWVTMKSSNNKPRSKTTEYPREDYKCLVRAVAGKKDKKREIVTLVAASQYPKFSQSMILIMKANMDALKKKDKSKALRRDA